MKANSMTREKLPSNLYILKQYQDIDTVQKLKSMHGKEMQHHLHYESTRQQWLKCTKDLEDLKLQINKECSDYCKQEGNQVNGQKPQGCSCEVIPFYHVNMIECQSHLDSCLDESQSCLDEKNQMLNTHTKLVKEAEQSKKQADMCEQKLKGCQEELTLPCTMVVLSDIPLLL